MACPDSDETMVVGTAVVWGAGWLMLREDEALKVTDTTVEWVIGTGTTTVVGRPDSDVVSVWDEVETMVVGRTVVFVAVSLTVEGMMVV